MRYGRVMKGQPVVAIAGFDVALGFLAYLDELERKKASGIKLLINSKYGK